METHDRLERQNTEQTAAGDAEDRTDMRAGKNKKIKNRNIKHRCTRKYKTTD